MPNQFWFVNTQESEMEWQEMIKTASTAVGNQRALAEKLGVPEQNINGAKAGKRGLSEEKCQLLADILGIDLGQVIQARQLALAKTDEQRAFWRPLVDQHRHAAALLLTIGMGGIGALLESDEARANDTLNVSSHAKTPDLIRVSGYAFVNNAHYAALHVGNPMRFAP